MFTNTAYVSVYAENITDADDMTDVDLLAVPEVVEVKEPEAKPEESKEKPEEKSEGTTEEETEDGLAWYCRVPNQPTSWTFGQYGTLNVRDIAYWQGNDAFATNGSYGCYMYDDGYTYFPLQYYVSAGNVGYTTTANCDTFIPSIYLETKEYVAKARALK